MLEAARAAAANILMGSLRLHSVRRGIPHAALVVDKDPCPLSAMVAQGYREAAANVRTADGHRLVLHDVVFEKETFLTDMHALAQRVGDNDGMASELMGCVLVQRGAFQNELRSYRLRLRLFELGLRVAEHVHLSGMSANDNEMKAYLNSCSHSPDDALREGRRIASAIDTLAGPRTPLRIVTKKRCAHPSGVGDAAGGAAAGGANHVLTYNGYLETCLLNTGYYDGAHAPERNCIATIRELRRSRATAALSSNPNPPLAPLPSAAAGAAIGVSVGGTFPTGEVITELEDLGALSGTASLFAFPNTSKRMELVPESFDVVIENGIIRSVADGAPPAFHELIQLIRDAEGGEAVVRELGIGLNPFIGRGPDRFLSDVTSFERQRGVHVSIGKRHPLFIKKAAGPSASRPDRPLSYKQRPLKRKEGMFHVDVFLDAIRLQIDGAASDAEHASPSFELAF